MPVRTTPRAEEKRYADDTRPSGWPCAFYVCTAHKKACFSDYRQAIADDSKPCIICEPCENDSLGG